MSTYFLVTLVCVFSLVDERTWHDMASPEPNCLTWAGEATAHVLCSISVCVPTLHCMCVYCAWSLCWLVRMTCSWCLGLQSSLVFPPDWWLLLVRLWPVELTEIHQRSEKSWWTSVLSFKEMIVINLITTTLLQKLFKWLDFSHLCCLFVGWNMRLSVSVFVLGCLASCLAHLCNFCGYFSLPEYSKNDD